MRSMPLSSAQLQSSATRLDSTKERVPPSLSMQWQLYCPFWGEHANRSGSLWNISLQKPPQVVPGNWCAEVVRSETRGPLSLLFCIRPPNPVVMHLFRSLDLVGELVWLGRSRHSGVLSTTAVTLDMQDWGWLSCCNSPLIEGLCFLSSVAGDNVVGLGI